MSAVSRVYRRLSLPFLSLRAINSVRPLTDSIPRTLTTRRVVQVPMYTAGGTQCGRKTGYRVVGVRRRLIRVAVTIRAWPRVLIVDTDTQYKSKSVQGWASSSFRVPTYTRRPSERMPLQYFPVHINQTEVRPIIWKCQ